MASLQEALQYAAKNPTSDFARQLAQHIQSGAADQEAQSLGIDLTPIKSSPTNQQTPYPVESPQSVAKPSIAQQVVGDPSGNTLSGFVKGAGRIARNLLGTAQGAGQRILGAITPGQSYDDVRQTTGFDVLKDETASGQKAKESLTANTTAEKLGSTAAEIASLAIPATRVSNVTKGLSFIPRTIARAGTDVAASQLASGGEDNATATGIASAGFETVSPALKFLGRIAKGTAGVLSGAGSEVIEQTLKTPRATKQAISIPSLQSIKEDTANVLSEVRGLVKSSSENYGKALEELPQRLGRNPKVVTVGDTTTISAGGKKYILSMQSLKSNLTETLRRYGVDVNPKKKELDFLGTTLDGGEENRLREVFDVVNSWKDTTPKGLNTLATKLNNFKKADTQSKQLNSIIGSISGNVRDYIGKRVPAVKELNDRFAKEQNFIDELDTYLSSDIGFDTPANTKAVAQKIQTLFTKNKDMAREVLENLASGQNIIARQAGRELSGDISRSTATIGDKIGGLVQAVISPSVVGKLTANTGIALEKIQPLVDLIQQYSPTERAALITGLNNLLSD